MKIRFPITENGTNFGAYVTLEEVAGGVQITIELNDLSKGSIDGIFFDIADVTKQNSSRLNDFSISGTQVNATKLDADKVTNVGNSSIGGSTPGFDGGVDVTPNITATGSVATFFVSLKPGLASDRVPTLLDFIGQRFGVRLKSQDGTSTSQTTRLLGNADSLAFISGSVFEDKNGNGIQDDGSSGLSGVKVTWAGADQQFDTEDDLTTETSATGAYRLVVKAGIASQVRFSSRDGYTFTVANASNNDALDSDVNAAGLFDNDGNGADTITLSNCQTLDIDAGFVKGKAILAVTKQTYLNNSILQAYDGDNDGVQEIVYLAPREGQSFDQIFRIENTGKGTAIGQELIFTATGSPYVDLSNITISSTNDADVSISVQRINADQFKVIVNGLDGNTTGYPANNKFIELAVNSTITNPTGVNQITPEPLSFTLRDDNNSATSDFGNVTINSTVFFSETGFSTGQSNFSNQRTAFSFAPFDSSQIEVNFANPDSIDLLGQPAKVARAAGSFTDKTGIFRNLFLFDFKGDLDLITRSTGGTKSNPLDIFLTLVWFSDLVLPINAFTGDSQADYQTFLNTYVNGGYFDSVYAAEQRKGVSGAINISDPTTGQSFTQSAVAGELGDTSPSTSLTTIDFPLANFPKVKFQQFVDSPGSYLPTFDPNRTYLIRISSSVSSIEFSQYNQATAQINIGAIQLLGNASRLVINNGSKADDLDLSGTLILNASGKLIGAKIFGSGSNTQGSNFDRIIGSLGNDEIIGTNGGDDILRGSFGNDTLTGSNGRDTFVLAAGEGNDTITDFKISLDRIGLAGGLTRSQLIADGNKIKLAPQYAAPGATGSEVLATLAGFSTLNLNNINFVTI